MATETITVVNFTDAPIQSAVTVASKIHSGINGILPNVYYHHNTLPGTYYDVWVKWYIQGIVPEFPESDFPTEIAWYIAGAVVTVLGIVATSLSAGLLAPALGAFTASIAGIEAGSSAAVVASTVTAATSTFIAEVGAVGAGALGTVTLSTIAAITKVGMHDIGQAIFDYFKTLEQHTVSSVPGGQNKILCFTGKIPLEVSEEKDAEGKTTTTVNIPEDKTTGTQPTYHEEFTFQQFDMMRRKGEIYQIKHNRDGEYCDETQGYVRMNLRQGEWKVTHGGLTLDISKIYRISLIHEPPGSAPTAPFYDLVAGEDEGDEKVYLREMDLNRDRDQDPSCWFWQLIPTDEGGGGWIIVDRRYVRFLYRSGSEILQYQSEEAGITVGTDGWASNVTLPGMVWDLSSFRGSISSPIGHIGQPDDNPEEWICVTASQDFGSLYASPHDSPDGYQQWHLEAQD